MDAYLQQFWHVLDALEAPQDGMHHIWSAGAEELNLPMHQCTQAQRKEVRVPPCFWQDMVLAFKEKLCENVEGRLL